MTNLVAVMVFLPIAFGGMVVFLVMFFGSLIQVSREAFSE